MIQLTDEQKRFADHPGEAFLEACPGAGKTSAIVMRIARLVAELSPRRGIAFLSFTNSAVDEFLNRCHRAGIRNGIRFPGFVGTFDRFISHFIVRPAGLEGVSEQLIVVDSWRRWEVRLKGVRSQVAPTLDLFHPETGKIDLDGISDHRLRTHVKAHQEAYEEQARRLRSRLHGQGLISAADARLLARRRLHDCAWAEALGRALAARFIEVIVDEAQDCNPSDIAIIRWLRRSCVPVTVVCDADQAIYGFRHGGSGHLSRLRGAYNPEDRLQLTRNFRSTIHICRLAATLRSRSTPDEAVGANASLDIPIHVMTYSDKQVPARLSDHFQKLLQMHKIAARDAIVLAHSRRTAREAAGLVGAQEQSGDSNLARLARAVVDFWSAEFSGRGRSAAVEQVQTLLLQIMDKMDRYTHPQRAAEAHAIDRRWLQRTAVDVLTRLSPTCEPTHQAAKAWVGHLRQIMESIEWPCPPSRSVRQHFRLGVSLKWAKQLQPHSPARLQWATIHEAKGREYGAVLMVIPPDRGPYVRTERLMRAWERGSTDEEAKRVLYVGVTRAKKLCALALPEVFWRRIEPIIERSRASYKVTGV